MIEVRQQLIVKQIYENKNPLSANDLAEKLKCSSKTIRNSIKDFNEHSYLYGCCIQLQRGIGYQLEIENQELFQSFLFKFQKENLLEEKEKRIWLIGMLLIFRGDWCSLEDLAEQIYVSRSTLVKDLTECEKKLMKYQLEFSSKSGKGIRMVGSEQKLREFCVHAVINYPEFGEINSILPFVLSFKELVEESKIILQKLMDQYWFVFSEEMIREISVEISMILERVKQGYLLQQDYFEVEMTHQILWEEWLSRLESLASIQLPSREKSYIYALLQAKQMYSEEKVDNHIYDLVDEFLSIIQQQYHFDLFDSSILVSDLAAHLQGLKYRLTHQINIRNAMVKQIKENYPLAFEMSLNALRTLFSEYDLISDEEVAFVALHIGVALEKIHLIENKKLQRCLIVCGSGKGTAKMLERIIVRNLESIIVERILSKREYDQQLSISEDIVISTIDLEKKNKPVFLVQKLPTQGELQKVEDEIKTKITSSKKKIFNFFSSENFYVGEWHQSKESLLLERMNRLEKNEIISDSKEFYCSIMQREGLGSTVISSYLATPHPMALLSKKSRIDVCILRNGVQWNETETVKLIFLLALSPVDYQEVIEVYDYFLEIIRRNCEKRLIDISSYEEFIQISEEIIQGME